MERTCEDFVDDMLNNGRDWVAIIAVSRFVRDGKWRESCKKILQEKNLMPKDCETAAKIQNESNAKAIQKKDLYEKEIIESRKHHKNQNFIVDKKTKNKVK